MQKNQIPLRDDWGVNIEGARIAHYIQHRDGTLTPLAFAPYIFLR